jgi:pimeloyl-ACP methyl ester carboxylesterase
LGAMLARAGAAILTCGPPVIAGLLTGCSADTPRNPSLSITVDEAGRELGRIRESRAVPPVRPIVVIGGLYDVGLVVRDLRLRLTEFFPPESPIVSIGLFGLSSEDECRDRVIEAVERALGPGEPGWTVEVDVVGFSMGGIVARHAALARDDGGTRLRIARLFTLATPHRGAKKATLPTLDPLVVDVRPGSAELARLDAARATGDDGGYEIYPYVRLGDEIVGDRNASPPGEGVWWVANRPLEWAHGEIYADPRITLDVVRRLRGEDPVASEPRAQVPR